MRDQNPPQNQGMGHLQSRSAGSPTTHGLDFLLPTWRFVDVGSIQFADLQPTPLKFPFTTEHLPRLIHTVIAGIPCNSAPPHAGGCNIFMHDHLYFLSPCMLELQQFSCILAFL
ncbi:hypothetical protein DR999_PMT09507 [Platysternon megacephalum]|uniref:Uncharacterized protein n=1 Tax=Platysternon megacephalum TaxID=55544 RepID=A0A4D9EAP9_9SAUR|nr:hypothetical protein DR999_PMT09507 [Platysternon megacephalum]